MCGLRMLETKNSQKLVCARVGGDEGSCLTTSKGDELVHGPITLLESIACPASLSSLAKAVFHALCASNGIQTTPIMSEGISRSPSLIAHTFCRPNLPMK